MKTKAFLFSLLLSLSCFLPLHAQVEQVAVTTGKQLPQGATDDNGTATITAPTKNSTLTSKTLLADLALDETAAGKWFTKYPNKVPPNAKLEVVFPFRSGFVGLSYRVISGTNIVDVSNIISEIGRAHV